MGEMVRQMQTFAFAAFESSTPTFWLPSTLLLLIISSCYGTPRTSVPKNDAGSSDAGDVGNDAADAVLAADPDAHGL